MMAKRHGQAALILAAAIALAGCSSESAGPNNFKILTGAAKQAVQIGKANQTPAPKDGGLTREMINQAGVPLLSAKIVRSGAEAIMGQAGARNGVVTWTTSDRKTISLRNGIVAETRGFGDDIMSAATPSAGQIARGQGTHQRVNYYLDGEDDTVRKAYDCELASLGAETVEIVGRSYNTRHITETCIADYRQTTNHYWIDSGSNIRQSKQWISPSVGYLILRRLND